GIPPAPRGIPQIEVTFDINADGILDVSAEDKATGREQHITITASSGLADEEVEQMVKDAERFAAEDRKRKEEAEARNDADSATYVAEKALHEQGEKVPADVKSDVESKVSALQTALQGKDVDEIRRRTQELGTAVQQIGASMYEQAGPTPPPPGEEEKPPEGGETVEGEFREV
ncbi:MAG: Hsp70 family protein, partial [Anaerolineales bacterium]|nr:Hsp70 family protein [Anaerolineales bacterium]